MTDDEQKIKPTKHLLIFGSLTIAVWVALATAACWTINSTIGLIFLTFSMFSILIIIRRQMCNSCYYCASCTKGFAKMSKLFLGGNHIPGIGKGTTIGMAAYIYVLLSIIPGALLASSLLQEFVPLKLLLLIFLITISVYNFIVRARNLIH